MNTELRQPLTELAQGRTLAVHNGRGRAIVVFSGQVWITQDDDLRDTFVGAGESFELDHDGLALATALSHSQLMVLNAAPTAEPSVPTSFALALWGRQQRAMAIGEAIGSGAAWLLRAAGRAWARARSTLAPPRREPRFI